MTAVAETSALVTVFENCRLSTFVGVWSILIEAGKKQALAKDVKDKMLRGIGAMAPFKHFGRDDVLALAVLMWSQAVTAGNQPAVYDLARTDSACSQVAPHDMRFAGPCRVLVPRWWRMDSGRVVLKRRRS